MQYTTELLDNRAYSRHSRVGRLDGSIIGSTVSTCSADAPTAYIGEAACIFQETNSYKEILLAATSRSYNSSAVSGGAEYTVSCALTGQRGSYYFSRGSARYYNGNGYTEYDCTRTVNMGLPSGEGLESAGSAEGIPAGSEAAEKQMILAMGQNGRIGYVKQADLDAGQPETPEEAVRYMEQLREDYENGVVHEIPLYGEDGVTVIDSFLISYPLIWNGRGWEDLRGKSVSVG